MFNMIYELKCFDSFVESAVNAQREGDDNPHSSVVAETTTLLANSSYKYQLKGRSLHILTKYLNNEKTHQAVINKFLKRQNYLNDILCEVESLNSKVEHKGPIFVGSFFSQYAKPRMLDLYCNFLFENFVTSVRWRK